MLKLPLYYGIYFTHNTRRRGGGLQKNTSKTSQNLITNLHPRHFLNGMKFHRICFVACRHAIAIGLSSASQKMLEKKEVGKFFEALHPLIFHWMECGTNYVATPWQNCIILHIFSLSELCDAMSTKSRKVHHLDCKNRSEKRTCTSNSEVYSHKWITIFYIWISICSLRVAAQEPSFYGIRRWALRVCMGNMTERWLLLLSGNASGICLDEMGCRPFSVFFQKPPHKNQVFVLFEHTLPKLCFAQR